MCGPTECTQLSSFGDCVVIAVSLRWIDDPFLAGDAAKIWLRTNGDVNHAIDVREHCISLGGQLDRTSAKRDARFAALFRIAHAEFHKGEWCKGRCLKCDSLTRQRQIAWHADDVRKCALLKGHEHCDARDNSEKFVHAAAPVFLLGARYEKAFENLSDLNRLFYSNAARPISSFLTVLFAVCRIEVG